jgi:hypothetical protein
LPKAPKKPEKPEKLPPKGDDDFAQTINSILDESVLRQLQKLETLQSGATKQILDAAIAGGRSQAEGGAPDPDAGSMLYISSHVFGSHIWFHSSPKWKAHDGLTSIVASLGGGGVLTIGRPLWKAVRGYEIKKKAEDGE